MYYEYNYVNHVRKRFPQLEKRILWMLDNSTSQRRQGRTKFTKLPFNLYAIDSVYGVLVPVMCSRIAVFKFIQFQLRI